ncbi:MAG: hypothetical protein CML02_06965 [Pseudooceanicola sp.]|nr:hypothetical protein [Pseudooceanicola sp.]
MRCSLIALCAGLPMAAPVVAQDLIELDPISVEAEADQDAPPTTAVISAEQMETQYQGAPLGTVLRGSAGVTVQGGTVGGGEMTINIRGLQEQGRIAVTVDGMRENFARAGHSANGSFSVDNEMLREVQVSRGPGAKAGAIGGAVNMRRVRADDLLSAGEATGGEFRLRYGSDFHTPTVHGAWATRLGAASDLTLAFTRAQVDDYHAPDGTQVYAAQLKRSLLATLATTTEAGNRLSFTASQLSQDYITGQFAGTPRDNDLRKRDYRFGYEAYDVGGWALDASAYQITTDVTQRALAPLAPETRSYTTQTRGALIEAARTFDWGGRTHDIAFTLDAFRDSVVADDPSGSLTPSGSRSFLSLAATDRIALGRAALTLGLSGDLYRLDSPDGSASGQGLSPRVTVEVPLTEATTLHSTLAMTYRFPTLSEALVSGLHPEPANFEIRPNPSLGPEKSLSFDLGVSHQRSNLFTAGDTLDLRATVFQNRVRDYIGLERVGGLFNSYYRYANINRVRLRGIELDATYTTDAFYLQVSGQKMVGINLDTRDELERVPPDRLVLTAGLHSRDRRGAYGIRYTATGSKGGTIPAQAWNTVDLFLHRDIGDSARLSLALNNITDETYTPHLEIQPAQSVNAQLSVTLRF